MDLSSDVPRNMAFSAAGVIIYYSNTVTRLNKEGLKKIVIIIMLIFRGFNCRLHINDQMDSKPYNKL